ncbi:MAG: HAD-IA family hydrolase [Gemmatimonadota bacterium]
MSGAGARIAAVEAILFDVTGTLIEVRGGVGELYAAAARAHGIDLDANAARRSFETALAAAPPLAFAAGPGPTREAAERGWWRDVVARVVAGARRPAAADPPDQVLDDLLADLWRRFASAGAWRVRDGAAGVLRSLRRRGYRLAVLSNFDSRLPPLLAELELADAFEAVFTSSDLGAAKPDAEAFRRALAHLDVPAAAAAHVGDSPEADARGAAAAGLLPVLLRVRLPSGVDGLSVDRLGDLLDLFGASRTSARDPRATVPDPPPPAGSQMEPSPTGS